MKPETCWIALSVILLCLAAASPAKARADAAAPVPADLQSHLVQLFSEHRCDEIIRRMDPDKVLGLRPNVMAIVAFCDPPWEDPEKIFTMAEDLSPAGDLILVLHAKYRTKKNHDSAAPIWNKVLLTARNPAFREMAEDYFSGTGNEDRPINLSSTTVFGSIMTGAAEASNPRPQELSYLPTHGSGEVFAKGELTWRHWFRWGSIAPEYGIGYNNYFSESQYTLMDQTLEIPVALHVSPSKDIVFSPMSEYSTVGGSLYGAKYGIKVSGAIYKSTYRQSVEGAVFQDNYYVDQINAESAAHYRFLYGWEFFPKLTHLAASLRIEHASAGNASEFNGASGYFPFSHTDVGVQASGERTFKRFVFDLGTGFAYRFDSDQSTFPLNTTGEIVVKRRVDKIFDVKPSVTIPLTPVMQLYAWYEYDRIWSNMGPHDYVNFNLTDNVAGLALKASLSTY